MAVCVCSCVDLEYNISQLVDVCVPSGCLLSVDNATEREALPAVVPCHCVLCRVIANTAVYLWFLFE